MTNPIDALLASYRTVDPDSRPMMRWWWFGPDLNRSDLERQLQAMVAAGIGGVEVAFVHPLQPGAETFLSSSFLADLGWTASRAAELGLRFDLTLGSGWSFGGPHITPDLAAHELHWQTIDVSSSAQRLDLPPLPGERLLGAYLGWAESRPGDPIPSALPVDGSSIEVPAADGVRRLYLARSRPTGQQVKRAARGAEGPVLDHYSSEALARHLDLVATPLVEAINAPIGSVFCDSLEVYRSNWTPALPAEFARRRGYDLIEHLPLLIVDGDHDGRDQRSVRADFHLTLAELYRENFLAPLTAWAHLRGLRTRVQNYGTPPGLLASWAEIDLLEGEGWGWAELTATRWAASAAHALGRGPVSAEAFTWLHSPSLRATPLDLIGEAHEHLLNGVTQLIGHGWPYSPTDAASPGWLFYAAGCFDDRNPWWPVMPELTRYLARQCWLLRQGERQAQVAIVLPSRDLLARLDHLDVFSQASVTLSELVGCLRRHGVDYDLLDDELIATTQQPTTQQPTTQQPTTQQHGVTSAAVVIVPFATELAPNTIEWLHSLERDVWLYESTLDFEPSTTLSLEDLPTRLTAALPWATLQPTEIGWVRRRVADHLVHWLANTTGAEQSLTLPVAGDWRQLDAATGEQIDSGWGPLEVTLAPHQATVVITAVEPGQTPVAKPLIPPDQRWTPLTDWIFSGPAGTEQVEVPHRWEDDDRLRHFSGSADYSTTISVADDCTIELDLGSTVTSNQGPSPQRGMVGPSFRAGCRGPVGEVAQIFVDDQPLGWLWAPPCRLRVTIGAGTHRLVVRVTNTAANALAVAVPGIERRVAELEQVHGRRFVMQGLDRAADDVSSGLISRPGWRVI